MNICRLLNRIGDVSLAVLEKHRAVEETVRLNMREFDVRMALSAPPREHSGFLDRLRWRIRHELNPRCIATDAYAISGTDRERLLDLLREFELIWIQDVKTADCCRIERWPRSVLDTVDIPSDLYRSVAQMESSFLRRLRCLRLSWIWKRRQGRFAERFEVLIVCSDREVRSLGAQVHIHVIPNGCIPQASYRRPSDPPRIGFIGTLGYAPNMEGVEWFVREVWPSIKQQVPQIRLRLVGSGSDVYAHTHGADIAGLGWLEDPGEEMATWSAMIVPIRFGAGTRVKMAEGFARKCPIVATSIGAFGFGVRDGEEFLLADDARDFASACVRLARDPELGRALTDRAHQRFLREWSWDAQEGKVRAVIRECLARSGRPQGDERVGPYADCDPRTHGIESDAVATNRG